MPGVTCWGLFNKVVFCTRAGLIVVLPPQPTVVSPNRPVNNRCYPYEAFCNSWLFAVWRRYFRWVVEREVAVCCRHRFQTTYIQRNDTNSTFSMQYAESRRLADVPPGLSPILCMPLWAFFDGRLEENKREV